MSIPDPFRPLEGGALHRLDIAIAEGLGGRPNKTITWHMTGPLRALGVGAASAAALLHWALIGAVVGAVVGGGYGAYRWVQGPRSPQRRGARR